MKTICIMCPMGCTLNIERREDQIIVKGNHCKKGEVYGRQEFIAPKRVVTSLVRLKDGGVVSVKTDGLVDKEKIMDILNELKGIELTSPIKVGDVIIKNILNTGVDIVATREG